MVRSKDGHPAYRPGKSPPTRCRQGRAGGWPGPPRRAAARGAVPSRSSRVSAGVARRVAA